MGCGSAARGTCTEKEDFFRLNGAYHTLPLKFFFKKNFLNSLLAGQTISEISVGSSHISDCDRYLAKSLTRLFTFPYAGSMDGILGGAMIWQGSVNFFLSVLWRYISMLISPMQIFNPWIANASKAALVWLRCTKLKNRESDCCLEILYYSAVSLLMACMYQIEEAKSSSVVPEHSDFSELRRTLHASKTEFSRRPGLEIFFEIW